ncbi:hypothetical protein ABT095_13065 [Kitasatospora sp. NPDC002227]|uniref:hypothetical protein n=1 Tax=Kitasatospora sp. NPDC002227 TaxID=3154773 RepID=UPI0033298036
MAEPIIADQTQETPTHPNHQIAPSHLRHGSGTILDITGVAEGTKPQDPRGEI